MRLYAVCVYLFLYIPIGVIALFSFNAGRHASQLQGFSTKWYGKALSNPFVMDALETSLIVAFTSALFASVFGTMAAVALQGIKGPVRAGFDMLIYVAVMIPGIVIGIATGCMLVFILLMGEFLIPALLGGGKVFFVGNALVDLFLQSRNWAYGSAVAMMLIFIMLVTVTLYMRLIAKLNVQRDDAPLM